MADREMHIYADTLDRYLSDLDSCRNGAYEFVYSSLTLFAKNNPNASTVEYSDYIGVIYEQAAEVYGSMAARFACDFYDQCMDKSRSGLYSLEPAEITMGSGEQSTYALSVAHEYSKKIEKNGVENVATRLAKMIMDYVTECAQWTTIDNCARDSRWGVRYAIVPRGIDTCGFCIIQASRGFEFKDRDVFLHENCDCTVVPGRDEKKTRMVVDGYDPDYYLDLYKEAKRTATSREIDDISKELDNMMGRQGHKAKEVDEMPSVD